MILRWNRYKAYEKKSESTKARRPSHRCRRKPASQLHRRRRSCAVCGACLGEREVVHDGAVVAGHRGVPEVGGVGLHPQVAVAQLDGGEELGAAEAEVGGQPRAGVACRTASAQNRR